MDKKRKRKSLKLKVEHLKLELEDRKEETSKLEQQFLEELAKLEVEEIPHAPQKPLPTEPQHAVNVINEEEHKEPEEIKVPNEPSERPEEFRKMWKQIAAVTHPDRTNNDPEKTELYKRAAEAWSKGNYADLVSVALDLGITPPEDSELGLQVLEETAVDLEKKIKETEESVLWMWAKAPAEKKSKIIDLYLGSRGKKRKKEV